MIEYCTPWGRVAQACGHRGDRVLDELVCQPRELRVVVAQPRAEVRQPHRAAGHRQVVRTSPTLFGEVRQGQ
ncbi:hypothetical protein ACU686_03540 [Yinghuangia aomiensis]